MNKSLPLGFLDEFQTSKHPNPLYCHEDFLAKLAEHGNDGIGRRAAFLLQRLAVDARRQHYKPTAGINRGWRRSRLGGNHGNHFYAWWAPRQAQPLRDSPEFVAADEGSVFLRDIRHHDDHSPLNPQSLMQDYLAVSVQDLRQREYSPLPWTSAQERFAKARQPVRLLKGHPGSGKTSALWHAADMAGSEHILYVTYSNDLASLARDYFERFCSSHKRFSVVTFDVLLRRIVQEDDPRRPDREARARFQQEIGAWGRMLGPWSHFTGALYDEIYAHLVGEALPFQAGRFAACKRARVPDAVYRERRMRALGQAALTAVLEVVNRIEHSSTGELGERYFPELALAWRATQQLQALKQDGGAIPEKLKNFDYDCIAVDECQDLTPLETSVVVQIAQLANRQGRGFVPVLLAGDEAQTVRPTDFEWAWLSDLLHAQLGTPSEYKLAANLRSPRRIAALVNRVWDLYSCVQKQERPSGSGLAEIGDEANDQVLYCTAVPGAELSELLNTLSSREGMALLTLEEQVPDYVPVEVRSSVLTVAEAKGLDFHSVCVLDAGKQLAFIERDSWRVRADSDIEAFRKRLAIDQLRVAFSRPAERLIWLDVNPAESLVRQSIGFLNEGYVESSLSSCVPAALLQALSEEELSLEERVQRCEADARQYLPIRPEIAWSRAQQAVTLLGVADWPTAVGDKEARDTAYLTLAEVCFSLAMRSVRLPGELGRPDLFQEAHHAAAAAGRGELAVLIDIIGQIDRTSTGQARTNALVELARMLPQYRDQLESWVTSEIASRYPLWLKELEACFVGSHNVALLLRLLPPFYAALDISDYAARVKRLEHRGIDVLLKEKQYAAVLEVLKTLGKPNPGIEVQCLEGLGDFRAAAQLHQAAGELAEALRCYRAIPDLEEALKIVAQVGTHPAAESLQWMGRMQRLVKERPEKFARAVTSAEKKLLEEMLENALGVTRRKSPPRKSVKKAAARKKKLPN